MGEDTASRDEEVRSFWFSVRGKKGGGLYLSGGGFLMLLSGFVAAPLADMWPHTLVAVPFLLVGWWRGVRWQRWLAVLLLVVAGAGIYMSVTAEPSRFSVMKPLRKAGGGGR